MSMQDIRAQYPQYRDLSDDQLLQGLHRNHYADMPYTAFLGKALGEDLNTGTGAPALVRAVVGKESDPARRMAIMSRLYGPETYAAGDDNFVYRDPTSKKLTVYNPKGFDVGDVASLGREAAQLGTAIATAPATATGVGAVGSAAATAAAGQGYDYLADALLNRYLASKGKEGVDYKPASTAVTQGALDTGLGYLGGAALSKVGGLLSPVKQELYDAWRSLGKTPPSVGSVSDSGAAHFLENALANMWGSSGVMGKAAERGRTGLGDALDELSTRIAPNAPRGDVARETLGNSILDAANASRRAFTREAASREAPLSQALANQPADINTTMQWINDTAASLSPGMADQFFGRMTRLIGPAMDDAANGNLNFGSLWQAKKDVGKLLKPSATATTDNIDRGLLKRVNGLLSSDLDAAASAAGQGNAWTGFKDWYSVEKTGRDAFEKLLRNRQPASIGTYFTDTKVPGQSLDAAREVLGQNSFNDIAAGLVDRLGQGAGTRQGEFSPSSFLTNFSGSNKGMSDEAKAALLSGLPDPYDAANTLGAIETASEGLKNAGTFYNTSRTAPTLEGIQAVKDAFRFLAQGGAGYAGGGFPGLLSTTIGPWAAAKATTSPAVIKALASKPYQSFWEAVANPRGPLAASFKTGLLDVPREAGLY